MTEHDLNIFENSSQNDLKDLVLDVFTGVASDMFRYINITLIAKIHCVTIARELFQTVSILNEEQLLYASVKYVTTKIEKLIINNSTYVQMSFGFNFQ